MLKDTRIYLIGAGHVARTHAQAVRKFSGSTCRLSVTDVNPQGLASFSEEFPDAHQFNDVTSLLQEPPLPKDIVIVATPPVTHFELAEQALRSGRHVLSEKPLAMNTNQATYLLDLAKSQKKRLGCCSDRFLGVSATDEVKDLVASQTLGKLYHVRFIHRQQRHRPGIEHQPSSPWFLNRAQSGGGVLMDWGPYDIAVLNDVLRPTRIDVVSAWMAAPQTALQLPEQTVFDVETHIAANLRYHLTSGEVVHVSYERSSCTHGREASVAEIEGSEGAVTWDWLSMSSQESGSVTRTFDHDGQVVYLKKEIRTRSELAVMDRPLLYFYQKIQGKDSPAIVDEQAVFNFSCLQAMYACAQSGDIQTVILRTCR